MVKSQTDEKRRIKDRLARADFVFLAGLLFIGAVSLLAVQILMGKSGASVRITVNGNLYGTYLLSEEQEIPIPAEQSGEAASSEKKITNILKISDEKAKMTDADCPDKLCIHQNAISKQGETIVCLPNKVVVEITGEESAEFDSISR